MEKIDFRKENIPFTQIANAVLNDPNISFMAKGIYAYLYSKPEGWDFSEKRIANDATNSRTSVRTGIQELEDAGYLQRQKLANGRMIYKVVLSCEPKSQNDTLEPKSQKATVAKSHSGNLIPISNKEIKVIKSLSNKDIQADEFELPEWLNKEVWSEWVAYRKEQGKKLTDRSVKLQIKELSGDIPNHVAIIEQSIRNGWTGLFPLKANNQQRTMYVA
jgi:transcriptional regulator of heat shock response